MSSTFSISEKPSKSLSEFDFIHDPNDKAAKLGVGSFASVKLAREKKTGKLFALKIVKLPNYDYMKLILTIFKYVLKNYRLTLVL